MLCHIVWAMAQQAITVAVVRHRPLDRAALEALVATLPGLHVVALDADPSPQVILWDAEDAKAEDSGALEELPPRTALLLLASGDEYGPLPPRTAGLFSKDETPQALAAAIRQLSRGDQYLSASLVPALFQRHVPSPEMAQVDPQALTQTLTAREREILRLLAEGLSNKAIATRLYLSVRTVEGHLARLYEKLGVHSRTEAMRFAIDSHFTTSS